MTAKRFIDVSSDFYHDENARHAALQAIDFVGLPDLWRKTYIATSRDAVEPSGTCCVNLLELSSRPIFVEITELNNGLGEGESDPSHLAQLDYIQGVSSPSVRHYLLSHLLDHELAFTTFKSTI